MTFSDRIWVYYIRWMILPVSKLILCVTVHTRDHEDQRSRSRKDIWRRCSLPSLGSGRGVTTCERNLTLFFRQNFRLYCFEDVPKQLGRHGILWSHIHFTHRTSPRLGFSSVRELQESEEISNRRWTTPGQFWSSEPTFPSWRNFNGDSHDPYVMEEYRFQLQAKG
jgi:hypothetical protein